MKTPLPILAVLWTASSLASADPADCFQLIGVNPVLAKTAFPSIQVLHEWDGRIYMGYGDIRALPGPIIVTSFDPATKQFVAEFSSGTDLIKVFREVGDRLLIPSGDGVHYAGFSDYSILTGRSTGYSRTPIGMLHMWDAGSIDGVDLWAVGTPYGVSFSAGGERAWDNSRGLNYSSGWCFPMGGKMYMQDRTYLPDGTWEANSLTRIMFEATPFQTSSGELVVARSNGVGFVPAITESNLVSFDGQEHRTHMTVRDFAIENGVVYALQPDGFIVEAADLRAEPDAWQTTRLRGLPANAWTIAVHNKIVYAGTTTGELWAARLEGDQIDDYSMVGFVDELPDRFGSTLAMAGDRLLVGAPHRGGPEVQAGSVFLYQRRGDRWELEQSFAPSESIQQTGMFGSDVALTEDHLAIVADGYSTTGADRGDAARVHAYERTPAGWEEFSWSPLTIPFAQSVAISNLGELAIGAIDASARSVFSFYALEPDERRISSSELTPSIAHQPIPRIVYGSNAVVLGHRGDPSRDGGPGQAAVHFDGKSVLLSQQGPDWFAESMDHGATLLAVGAPADDSMGDNSGAVYLYDQTLDYDPAQRVTLHSPEPRPFSMFGSSVALGEDVLIVGAQEDECAGRDTGAAYLYRRGENGQWNFDYKIGPPASAYAGFGAACAIAGNQAAIGADFAGRGTGAVSELPSRLRIIDTRPCPLRSWGGSHGLTDLQTISSDDEDGDGDGLIPLLEFACNLDPTVDDKRHLAPGTGRAGLPVFIFTDQIIEAEFLRRRDGSLQLLLESSPDGILWGAERGWSEVVGIIDDDWERVRLSKARSNESRRLLRFAVHYRMPGP